MTCACRIRSLSLSCYWQTRSLTAHGGSLVSHSCEFVTNNEATQQTSAGQPNCCDSWANESETDKVTGVAVVSRWCSQVPAPECRAYDFAYPEPRWHVRFRNGRLQEMIFVTEVNESFFAVCLFDPSAGWVSLTHETLLWYAMYCLLFAIIRSLFDSIANRWTGNGRAIDRFGVYQCCGDNKCEFLFMELLLSHIVYVNSNKVMADMADERLSYK